MQFSKGPYSAEEGDFSTAGASHISYVNALDAADRRAERRRRRLGTRCLCGASPRVGGGHLLGALELGHNDGPWMRPDDYRKVNGVLRYSRGDTQNAFSLTGMGYAATGTRPIRCRSAPSRAA